MCVCLPVCVSVCVCLSQCVVPCCMRITKTAVCHASSVCRYVAHACKLPMPPPTGEAKSLCDGHKAYLLLKALRTFNGTNKFSRRVFLRFASRTSPRLASPRLARSITHHAYTTSNHKRLELCGP